MRSDIEVKDIVFSVIKGSPLELAVSGGLYRDKKPLNSNKEDIVISILDGLNGQIQDNIINVNIYVPDILRGEDNVKVEDSNRLRELAKLAIELLNVYNGSDDGFRFEIEKQPIFKVNGVDEHCINTRLKFKITNF